MEDKLPEECLKLHHRDQFWQNVKIVAVAFPLATLFFVGLMYSVINW